MKEIDINYAQLSAAEQALFNISTVEMPIKSAYALAKTINSLAPQLQIFHDLRNQIIQANGDGGDSQQRLFELATTEVCAEIAPIPISVLEDIATITPETLLNLGPLLEEEII